MHVVYCTQIVKDVVSTDAVDAVEARLQLPVHAGAAPRILRWGYKTGFASGASEQANNSRGLLNILKFAVTAVNRVSLRRLNRFRPELYPGPH